MSEFEIFAKYTTHPNHAKLFQSKELVISWAYTYPMIFDEDDLRIAETQAEFGSHFHEWLAAVLVYHTYGYFSLVEKYQFKNHKKKQAILKDLAQPDIIKFMEYHPEFGNTQCPDLLVYKPDKSEWFFCEVKGPNDRLRDEQVAFFHELARVSEKHIRMVEFTYLPKEYH